MFTQAKGHAMDFSIINPSTEQGIDYIQKTTANELLFAGFSDFDIEVIKITNHCSVNFNVKVDFPNEDSIYITGSRDRDTFCENLSIAVCLYLNIDPITGLPLEK